ncbi:hypothetical protein QFE97_13795 [Bacillus subtilis]|nr:hypothetical protein QFE97_13795 [Bacillus subtilis]
MSSDETVFENYDEGARRGEIFATCGFVFVTVLWVIGLAWNFRDYLNLRDLIAPENWGYWIAMAGTSLGAAAAASKSGIQPERSLRDTASLLGWALLFISSVVPLAVTALCL